MTGDETAAARRVEACDDHLRQLREAHDLIDTLIATGSGWRDRMVALANDLDDEGNPAGARIRAQLRKETHR